ncbi:hypothetical protein U1Q18_021869 [Sarracenia purpurea var. burkii]
MSLLILPELDDLSPLNSLELGIGANAAKPGEAVGDCWPLEDGKFEDMLGAVTYGETTEEAKIVGKFSEHGEFKLEKKMSIDKTTKKNLVIASNGDLDILGRKRWWLSMVQR